MSQARNCVIHQLENGVVPGMKHETRLFYWFGIFAPLAYAFATLIGGFLVPGYSHLYNTISELTASNLPKDPIIYTSFAAYNISLVLFGVGLHATPHIVGTLKGRIGALLFMAIGWLGIAMLLFTRDPRTGPITTSGQVHLILGGTTSLLTMITMIVLGWTLRAQFELPTMGWYSLISFALVLILGGVTGITVTTNAQVGGLFERLTMGAFLQWVFVVAIVLLRESTPLIQKHSMTRSMHNHRS